MKSLLVIATTLVFVSSAHALELKSEFVNCIDQNTLSEIEVIKVSERSVTATVYELDLSYNRDRVEFETPELFYDSVERKYLDPNEDVEVQLYRSKDQEYGAAIEIFSERYFNDMFHCKSGL